MSDSFKYALLQTIRIKRWFYWNRVYSVSLISITGSLLCYFKQNSPSPFVKRNLYLCQISLQIMLFPIQIKFMYVCTYSWYLHFYSIFLPEVCVQKLVIKRGDFVLSWTHLQCNHTNRGHPDKKWDKFWN